MSKTNQELINEWGISRLRKEGKKTSDNAQITLTESLPSAYFCETCGPDPIEVIITDEYGHMARWYGTLREVLKQILSLA